MDTIQFPIEGIKFSRGSIQLATPEFSEKILNYYTDNKSHLGPWEPIRTDDFYTPTSMTKLLEGKESLRKQGLGLSLMVLNHEGEMVGSCNFSNVVRGVFQACHLGFSASANFQGKGYMFEAITVAIRYCFDELKLHRIMANYIPRNERSKRLLTRLGFKREGYAKSYLYINGVWEDHILTSLINPHNENKIDTPT